MKRTWQLHLPAVAAGDRAPGFTQQSDVNPRYAFDTAAGRYLVLCFFGTASIPQAQRVLDTVKARTDIFDDVHASFFGVSIDPADQSTGRAAGRVPGVRLFWDFDLSVSRLYGATARSASPGVGPVEVTRLWVVIDPTMRVISVVPMREDESDLTEVLVLLKGLPPPRVFSGVELMAPVLYLPRVFEPDLCEHLIELYEANGGGESGFMREVDGRTMGVLDRSFKQRRDHDISDPDLTAALRDRIRRRVVPEIAKVHQFTVTRMERYIVSCYAAEEGGHFSAHRDNTTAGTAHRRFAVSVNLNADFDGGEISFPEYGPRGFKAPVGGAVVFSCSLLHKVSVVTRGRRYAFLPFLYDDAAAAIRERNARLVGQSGSGYQANQGTAPAG
jgi:peroxiredoxin/predicted 2-oxoglutarate/Fe(II)-dependent dioxygenase YbiX